MHPLKIQSASIVPGGDLECFLEQRPTAEEAASLIRHTHWRMLAPVAARIRDAGWGTRVTYSRKVFIPLTHLCRDVCHYCTFAATPRRITKPYLTPDDVLAIARKGIDAGCKEALFTLGDKPELRYGVARTSLGTMGFDSTVSYLESVADLVLNTTGLLPHLNPGLLGANDFKRLRRVAPSMGFMLETNSNRLSQRGGPHFGSPDKLPAMRLDTLRLAGEARVPTTSGILIGIGETRDERIQALLALRDLSDLHGHLQEVIIQNFRAKTGTKMHASAEPSMDDLCWTIAVARIIFGPAMSVQAPPNLYSGDLADPLLAGINDWGGISPVTPDHVNPEAPWPEVAHLADVSERAGFDLVERLTIYPRYIAAREVWVAPEVRAAVLRLTDGAQLARPGHWSAGSAREANSDDLHDIGERLVRYSTPVTALLDRLMAGAEASETDAARLFTARGSDFTHVCRAADSLRVTAVGNIVRYVVVRNINYTNLCLYKCGFCAFSKGKTHDNLRGKPYLVDLQEIGRRTSEAWERGATEVCMQGGIHPTFTGATYLAICRAAKQAVPEIHVHAFSPLEVSHGAQTLGLSIPDFLQELKAAGLGSLPGTAAEILDDDVRFALAPDKPNTADWLTIVSQAHRTGLPTTSTIMFGHLENYQHWARHLILLRNLQKDTGGITEFVPLPFVHMEAPMYLRGLARKGPTLREAILMHAVARIVLHPLIRNIQVSWTKMGPLWAQRCLESGANDLGGTLMNESISRAAGASHGQELSPQRMMELISGIGREPEQRTTLYHPVAEARRYCARHASPLAEPSYQQVTGKTDFAAAFRT